MHFAHKRLSAYTSFFRESLFVFFLWLILLTVILVPLLVFTLWLRAEGPIVALCIWVGVSASCFYFSSILKRKNDRPGRVGKILILLAGIIVVGGVLIILFQVDVTRRSLAEAWLELARTGKAFGSFSFFVAEIYALFSILQSLLFSRRQYLCFVTFCISTNALCVGIILNNAPLLILCICAILPFFATYNISKKTKQEGEKASRTTSFFHCLKSSFLPFFVAICFSAIFATWTSTGRSKRDLFPYPDFTELFIKIAPAFPLVQDVPGYGFETDAAEMPASVYLSNRTLFLVRGRPKGVLYLKSDNYSVWNGLNWQEDSDQGEDIPITCTAQLPSLPIASDVISLQLIEDFYPVMPVAQDTSSVLLTGTTLSAVTASRNKGIRFTPSAKRGVACLLFPGDDIGATPARINALSDVYLGVGSVKSPQIVALAHQIRQKSETASVTDTSDRAYIRALLSWFSTGYTYALDTGEKFANRKKGNSIENFLFYTKKGYCLHFASAFVLMARAEGLPARLAEGYRITLDTEGNGAVSGYNAHAWPEVWVDGDWRIFEPTPPFAQDNPFSYVANNDRQTQRQIEALFGKQKESETKHAGVVSGNMIFLRFLPIGGMILMVIIFVTLIIYVAANRRNQIKSIKRNACKMVRKFRGYGISGPEISGWLLWSAQVREYCNPHCADSKRGQGDLHGTKKSRLEKYDKAAQETALVMIKLAFDTLDTETIRSVQ